MKLKKVLFLTLIISLLSNNNLHSQNTDLQLETFIEKKRNYNQQNKNGYSIILYNGNEKEARNIFKDFKETYDNIEINLSYVSPYWKVITKSYSTKLKAERVFLNIKETYPNAKIL